MKIIVRYTGPDPQALTAVKSRFGDTVDEVVAAQGMTPLDALQIAIEMDFSFDALKSVVLIDCQNFGCQDSVSK